jgi:hypothetical protein
MDRFSIILKKPPPPKKKIKKAVKKKPVQETEEDELVEKLALTVSLLEQEIKHRKKK